MSEVEAEQHTVGAAVESSGDRLESLLTCRVPYLQANPLVHVAHLMHTEVNGNGGGVVLVEDILGEPHRERGLAHPAVADHNDLKDVVAVTARSVRVGHFLFFFFALVNSYKDGNIKKKEGFSLFLAYALYPCQLVLIGGREECGVVER